MLLIFNDHLLPSTSAVICRGLFYSCKNTSQFGDNKKIPMYDFWQDLKFHHWRPFIFYLAHSSWPSFWNVDFLFQSVTTTSRRITSKNSVLCISSVKFPWFAIIERFEMNSKDFYSNDLTQSDIIVLLPTQNFTILLWLIHWAFRETNWLRLCSDHKNTCHAKVIACSTKFQTFLLIKRQFL